MRKKIITLSGSTEHQKKSEEGVIILELPSNMDSPIFELSLKNILKSMKVESVG